MSERVERIIKEYPGMVRKVRYLRNQMQNFQGVTEQEVIGSMNFSNPEGERVQTSNVSDKTASISASYRDRLRHINREWINHLITKLLWLEEELEFFRSSLRALSLEYAAMMWDLVVEGLTWDAVEARYHICRATVGKYRKRLSANWIRSTPSMTRRWRSTYCDRRQQKMCRRGDIYFVNCGSDTSSSLQCGVRPVLVVSNDQTNTHSPVVTVVPLTGQLRKKRSLSTHALIPCSKRHGLTQPSVALAEQVTSMDKSKLVERRGHIKDHGIMAKVTEALQVQIEAIAY